MPGQKESSSIMQEKFLLQKGILKDAIVTVDIMD